MSKLGVISDIHGDVNALRTALHLLRQQGADQIVCTGDLVEGHPQNDAVVKLIIENHIPSVLGNHDQNAAYVHNWLHENHAEHTLSPKVLMQLETARYVGGLPRTLRLTIDGFDLLVAHGAPWDNTVSALATESRDLFERIAHEAEADVVLLGHTHRPMAVRVGITWVFNPGSVFNNRPPYLWNTRREHSCGLLSLPDCRFTVFNLHTGEALVPEPVIF
ncbi:MAG: metallophosphoesterase family protein [bacterium]|nr:metallophosphoesterase family protein [bacterium]